MKRTEGRTVKLVLFSLIVIKAHYALKRDIPSEFIGLKQVLQSVIFPQQIYFAKIPGGLTTERINPGENVLMYLATIIVLGCYED